MVRVSLIRIKVDKNPPHKEWLNEKVCEMTLSDGEYMKLRAEIRGINSIYAGGKQNRRYKLVEI